MNANALRRPIVCITEFEKKKKMINIHTYIKFLLLCSSVNGEYICIGNVHKCKVTTLIPHFRAVSVNWRHCDDQILTNDPEFSIIKPTVASRYLQKYRCRYNSSTMRRKK